MRLKNLASEEELLDFAPKIFRRLKSLQLTVDDIFVTMNIVEYLTTLVYNATVATIEGEEALRELLDSGSLEQLPENMKKVKDIFIKKTQEMRKKDKNL